MLSNFYFKKEYRGREIKIEFLGDELHTTCFKCGKEIQLDEEMMMAVLEDGDFMSTRISCGCDYEKPKLTRIK